ncbi:TnsA-like heteromeric transposase endonuclease subunit [Ornithinimicrobium avium]|uniref:TnsA-like heteromeric transposase endonuclease subunit n=1 Tax=Ornithinimicrobium avium TaxID=2283195 RepID=UPI0026BCD7FE|nr:TnsA-like heteromeric transposase endonuclease subunit [Ornithinimicrobium avium]
MGVREVSLRYCNVAGDEVTTTWREARAELIVEGLPVRIPPSYRGQGNYPGLFWSATNRRTLVYESLLELDRLWLADFDPTVVGIATQPFQITGSGTGAQPSHVPDVLLVHVDRTVTLVDVKPAEFLDKPAVRAQFDWTRGLCRDKGWGYEVFSGGDPVVLRTIKALAVGRRSARPSTGCCTTPTSVRPAATASASPKPSPVRGEPVELSNQTGGGHPASWADPMATPPPGQIPWPPPGRFLVRHRAVPTGP